MPQMRTLQDALIDEVRDLYHAEKQLVKALPKMAKAASFDELRTALEDHLVETENQVARLERVFELFDLKPRAKACAGMAGIIEEGAEMLEEEAEDSVRDAMIIAAAQRAEHYEIAAYGTARAFAEALGESRVADLLQQTLDEEGETNKRLTALSETVNADAVEVSTEAEEE